MYKFSSSHNVLKKSAQGAVLNVSMTRKARMATMALDTTPDLNKLPIVFKSVYLYIQGKQAMPDASHDN